MQTLLQIQDLQVDFNTETGIHSAVRHISLEVNRGEILAIVGESGSGKSVTALSILRLLPSKTARYKKGRVLFSKDGVESLDLLSIPDDDLRSIRGNEIGMIFQEPMTSLNPVFTCGDQVMEAIRLHQHVSTKEAKQKTIELFQKVRLPDPQHLFNRYPHQLSGGQKQRVMIAMAMSCQPSLLICDEPTTALDVTVQKTILQLIKDLQKEEQMGVIFITHDLGVVAEIADKAMVMYKGEIVEKGTTKEIFEKPQHPYTKGLLACRPILHEKGERLPVVSDFLENRIIEPQLKSAARQVSSESPLIRVENLKIWFPKFKTLLGKPKEFIKAVDDVSFDVMQGETLGLVGESGCGKTTLGRALLRLLPPTAGKIFYKNTELTSLSGNELKNIRKDIQIIFQDPYSSLNPRLTIGSAIAEPLKVQGILRNERQRRDKVVELLEKVSLKAEHYNNYPHEFSGGQRQRIVIARALALNPGFLVCDESVSALDVSVQAQVLNLLNDLKKEFGFTVVFISHDLSVVHYISDRIMVMNQGKIVETGTAEVVYHHPKNPYTQKLIASIPGKA